MAHATHPNYPERHEPGHLVAIDGGPVVKVNANQRYATDAATAATVIEACEVAGSRTRCSWAATTCPAAPRSGPSPPPASASPPSTSGWRSCRCTRRRALRGRRPAPPRRRPRQLPRPMSGR
ncbi:MAG: hypothetical protein R2746_08830 [Acidimicrobiales bacterium]